MTRAFSVLASFLGARFVETRLERWIETRRSRGGIPLRVRLWDGRSFDLSSEPPVTVTLTEPGVAREFADADLCTLAEAIIDGRIRVDGPMDEVIRVGEALARSSGASSKTGHRRRGRHTKEADAHAIRHHYDVSNDFYALWLDREMVYSCAYFRTGDEDLDTAQRQKLDHICRKLLLRPGDRLLDIGCGWGALIRHAAREYGAVATGITLSRMQYEYTQEHIRAEGLEDRCRVLLEDYRDHAGEGVYDKIASVGMFEHVGIANLPVYFGAVARLLKTGGLFLNHGITATNPDSREVGLGAGEFIDRHIFPQGELPHLALAISGIGAQGLEVRDVECLREHYARTLRLWTARLEERAEQARALAGERRYRTWLLYLAGCAHAFAHNWISIHQILAIKPDAEGHTAMPWTREFMYGRTTDIPR